MRRLLAGGKTPVYISGTASWRLGMDHVDFRIGLEFRCGDGRWRVTDVGTRTVVAIRVDQVTIASQDLLTGQRIQRIVDPVEENLLNGPPYAVAETIFDEDDWEACEPIAASELDMANGAAATGMQPEVDDAQGQGQGSQLTTDAVVDALRSLGREEPHDGDARPLDVATGSPGVGAEEQEATAGDLRWIRHHESDGWEPGLRIDDGRYETIGCPRPLRAIEVGPRLVPPVPGRPINTEASPSQRDSDFGQAKPGDRSDSLLELLRQDGSDGEVELPIPSYSDDRDALLREVRRLRDACAEAYQVVGTLGAAVGVSDAPELEKALDNLAAASRGEPCPHADLLPFVLVSQQS